MNKFEMVWDGQVILGSAIQSAAEAKVWIERNVGHYVYVLTRANGEPFYVGKGSGIRALQHEAQAQNSRENSHKLNLIRKLVRTSNVRYYLQAVPTHDEALFDEITLIKMIGRFDKNLGPLTNQTDGGEGTVNPSDESLERRRVTLAGTTSDNEGRNTINKWFNNLADVGSVPVKPVNSKYKIEGLWQNRNQFGKTRRQAAALVGALISNNQLLTVGVIVPRRFKVSHEEVIIENGVGRDILSSGMAILADKTVGYETFEITSHGKQGILEQFEKRFLISSGILDPTS